MNNMTVTSDEIALAIKTLDASGFAGAASLISDMDIERQQLRAIEPLARCAAIMAVAGYFGRMRGPVAFGVMVPTDPDDLCVYAGTNEASACQVAAHQSAGYVSALYAVPAPLPAVTVGEDARDAERYRFLRDNPFHWLPSSSLWVVAEEGGTILHIGKADNREQAIDAAILSANRSAERE